jgi:hypothetical protein
MSVLLTNECQVNGWGYICSEHEDDSHLPMEARRILVTFWLKDARQDALKRIFPSRETLYKQMLIFVKSPLANYSDRHRSKAFMGREFIEYYEQKNVSKRRIVH